MKKKTSYLKTYFYVFGFLNVFVITTVPLIFGDLFLWQPRNIPTEIMMASLYFAMGVVMIFAARNPDRHKALVDFVVLGNILHALVMLVTAQNARQIVLDVIPIGVMGVVPLLFYPWGLKNFIVKDVSDVL